MEALPDLALLYIAAELTGFELASWCAVSHSWRERLNQDDFWEYRCDKQTAEYLRQTECQVQPIFINPEEEEDTGLSEICTWRLAYMRQTHLWNNWRQDRFQSVFVPDETNYFTHKSHDFAPLLMYKNDFLIALDLNEMQLWRVQPSVVIVCLKTLPSDEQINMLNVFEDNIVVKQSNLFLMFEISIEKPEFVLKRSVITSKASFYPALLFKSILVEMQKDSFTMQVWNVESGEKLKEEKRENIIAIRDRKPCFNKTHFALTAKQSRAGQHKYFVLVYTFPDFTPVFTTKSYNDDSIEETVIVKDHLFLKFYNSIDSYCLQTGQQIKQIDIRCGTSMENFDQKVCFVDSWGNLVRLTPGSDEEEIVLSKMGYEIVDLDRLNSKYFLATVYLGASYRIWLGQLQGSPPGRVVDLGRFSDFRGLDINGARTKILLSYYGDTDMVFNGFYKERFEVISFW